MTPRQFFYPRVVIEFYHTMTSRREPNPTALHFSINGRPGILRASNITATFNLSVVLANSAAYRQWLHPSPREMVRLLSRDTIAGTILFRRQLPPRMHLIDHILWSNLFPLQHIVQRRGAILETLYRISEGFWFSPSELIMTSLFHFEDKVHRRSLPRAESKPLLFPRLFCQVLEHIGFLEEPRLERRRDCEVDGILCPITIICRLQTQPRTSQLPIFHLRTIALQQSTLRSLRLQPPRSGYHCSSASSSYTICPSCALDHHAHCPFKYCWAEHFRTASAVYHHLYPGPFYHHGCSPHILCHIGIICDYPCSPSG